MTTMAIPLFSRASIEEIRELLIEEETERWQQAVRVMEAMTPHEREKHFYMGDWRVQTECGTVGCLAGHCSLDSWFIARGLRVDEDQCNADQFFGRGSGILYLTRFSHGQVLKVVKAQIEKLKSGELTEAEWYDKYFLSIE